MNGNQNEPVEQQEAINGNRPGPGKEPVATVTIKNTNSTEVQKPPHPSTAADGENVGNLGENKVDNTTDNVDHAADENRINEDNDDKINDDKPADGEHVGNLGENKVDNNKDNEDQAVYEEMFGEPPDDNVDNATDDEDDNDDDDEMIGWEWSLVYMIDLIIAKATAIRNYLRQHPLPRPRLPRVAWRKRWFTLKNRGRSAWGRYSKKTLTWIIGVIVVVVLARLAYMIFGLQDRVQTFEEFTKEKDRRYSKVLDAQNFYVEDLLEVQADLKESIEAVEKASANKSDHHSGEIAKIQTSIIEVKDEFQRFMVESQLHMMELQEKSNKNQKEMAGMQSHMNKEMGSMREEVQDARRQFDEMKLSLHSIEYNIQNLKSCGFLSRLFGLC